MCAVSLCICVCVCAQCLRVYVYVCVLSVCMGVRTVPLGSGKVLAGATLSSLTETPRVALLKPATLGTVCGTCLLPLLLTWAVGAAGGLMSVEVLGCSSGRQVFGLSC